MGKKRFQKDRLYLTAKELREGWGGKKIRYQKYFGRTPFYFCTISMMPFRDPVCTLDGIIFDILNIVPYIQKYRKHPINGKVLNLCDLVKLNFCKLNDHEFYCPILHTAFTKRTHIIAIRPSGNVYSYEALNKLHLTTKNMRDLISGEPFEKSDIITIQTPSHIPTVVNLENKQIMTKTTNDKNLITINQNLDSFKTQKISQKISICPINQLNFRSGASTWNSDDLKNEEQNVKNTEKFLNKQYLVRTKEIFDKRSIYETTEFSTNKASLSFTSTIMPCETINERMKKRILRYPKVNGYVKLRTNNIDIDLELNCDVLPDMCNIFLILSQAGLYDNIPLNKYPEKFMIQSGKPRGSITANDLTISCINNRNLKTSTFNNHGGLISLNISEANTECPQFSILLKSAYQLDSNQVVFGKVLSGFEIFDFMENEAISNLDNISKTEIKVLGLDVLFDPFLEEFENEKYSTKNIEKIK